MCAVFAVIPPYNPRQFISVVTSRSFVLTICLPEVLYNGSSTLYDKTLVLRATQKHLRNGGSSGRAFSECLFNKGPLRAVNALSDEQQKICRTRTKSYRNLSLTSSLKMCVHFSVIPRKTHGSCGQGALLRPRCIDWVYKCASCWQVGKEDVHLPFREETIMRATAY